MRGERLLTRAEKEAVRNSPCGRCGRIPPFADGSRCQPHRIVPGHQGGKYTRKNTTPRCPECHDIEHGGTGAAPFIGAASAGGKKGAATVFAKNPEHSRQYGWSEARRRNPGLSKQAWKLGLGKLSKAEWTTLARKRQAALSPGVKTRVGKLGGAAGIRSLHEKWPGFGPHARWHLQRGIVNQECRYCRRAA